MTRAVAGPRTVGALVGLAAALIILGPALAPGFILHYDLVFVPRLGLGHRTLGIDGSVPRAVPGDLLVALASVVVPGWIVQKLALVMVFVAVGAGVGGLVRTRPAAAVAALAACWNPFVAERLAIGHWGFLLGYAVVPWAADAAWRWRTGRSGGLGRTALALTAAAATGSTGSLYAVLVIAVVGAPAVVRSRRRVRQLAVIAAVTLAVNAPWWWPYLTLAPSGSADPTGVTAFAARADTPWGVVGSVLTLGGNWNQATWFAERSSPVVSTVAVLAVISLVLWWVRSGRLRTEPLLSVVAIAGLIGVVVALAPVVAPGAMRWFVSDVPGGGLVRDSQKFVAVWAIWVASATGLAMERLVVVLRSRAAPRTVAIAMAVACALWPVVTLPTLGWGAAGRWTSAQYPRQMTAMAARLDRAPAGGVAVFPWNQYRRYRWNREQVVLDPWQRLVRREVVVNDALPLRDGKVVAGESRTARAIGAALGSPRLAGLLRAHGIRWVLIERDQPGQDVSAAALSGDGSRVVLRTADLELVDLGTHDLRIPAAPQWWAWLGLVGGALAAIGVVGANVGYTARIRTTMRGTSP